MVPGIDDSYFGQPIGGKNPFIYPQFETFDKPVVINHKNWDGLKDHITDCIGGRCDFGMKWETEDWGYGIFLYTTKEATLEYKPTLIIYYY